MPSSARKVQEKRRRKIERRIDEGGKNREHRQAGGGGKDTRSVMIPGVGAGRGEPGGTQKRRSSALRAAAPSVGKISRDASDPQCIIEASPDLVGDRFRDFASAAVRRSAAALSNLRRRGFLVRRPPPSGSVRRDARRATTTPLVATCSRTEPG
uniref:Uncharacterized protein n=1 Tax=Odontella aurita TaxID=265563 RepID=A0A7S4KC60_9STRA|mmetsp:Transcript_9209/g.27731  ORF Transcript_9209/g.27731 Transcript_9209/m.27731 type:complete len:154 (+) Transcript_9209:196-657(+)